MTPKEKAIELYNKMYDFSIFDESAKQCALIAVDEVLNTLLYGYNLIEYWKEVKKEIEAL
jgi:hypothetical protein